MRLILILSAIALAVWAIAGCSAVNPGPCPPLKAYTAEENNRLADELDALPEGSITIDVIADYMVLRDQVRACQ